MSAHHQDADSSFIAEVLPAFISEAQEQIETIEQLLLQLEDAPQDRDLLDALFRCAHTVKGSAGIFGLDLIVGFTHHVESLLDRLRDGHIALSPDLSTLLLQCNDEIRALINLAQAQTTDGAAGDDRADARTRLVARLLALSGSAGTAPLEAPRTTTPIPQQAIEADGSAPWHVSIGFGQDTFRNGMDPLAVLNYVRKLGNVPRIACDADAVPPLDAIDPESCHLAFEFSLDTEAPREAIEDAFSFVRDDCVLHLIGPEALPEHYAALIEALPDNPRIGDILVSVGAITPEQLQQGLKVQARAASDAGVAPPIGEILASETGVSPKIIEAALDKQQKRQKQREGSDDNRFIRVHADRLDEVINLLGELVIAGAGASLLARQTSQSALIEANQQISRLIEEIRNGTLQLRMVPIGETFSRFRRVVRDTAAELGKDVAFEIVGAETELDKSVVERIADPLMHLVRNALDHGLETAEERVASGKPAQGRLTLSACHESGGILIRIDDDGRGINRNKVLKRAWERGLLEQGSVPADADILKLIFEPGFSTAEQITNLSGRGVGMDVVRRNIEALRGSVNVRSDEGQGSRIEIRLPLTLAIIDGFLIGVGNARFIFPLEAVVEVIEASPGKQVFDERGRSCMRLREQLLPVMDLRRLYGMDGEAPLRGSVVVVKIAGACFGVLVDTLLGQHQTVIKPLGRMFRSLRGISGSTILGNGEVALIFDVNALGELAAADASSSSPRPHSVGEPS